MQLEMRELEYVILVVDIDECASSPCMGNSTTDCTDLLNAFQCNCEPGYNGTFCETGEISDCILLSGRNNGGYLCKFISCVIE